jgi:hypothetical protein
MQHWIHVFAAQLGFRVEKEAAAMDGVELTVKE